VRELFVEDGWEFLCALYIHIFAPPPLIDIIVFDDARNLFLCRNFIFILEEIN